MLLQPLSNWNRHYCVVSFCRVRRRQRLPGVRLLLRELLKSTGGIRILSSMKWFALVLAAMVAVGCGKNASPLPTTTTTAPPGMPPLPTHAQPKLTTMKLWMGSEEVTAELALTEEQQRVGMMFRTNIEENSGMLFVFPGPWRPGFWMKNCPSPLNGAYIDPGGRILEIIDMHAEDTNTIVAKTANVQYVLEMKEGWFKRHNIGEGTLIRTERGSLRETFFGQ